MKQIERLWNAYCSWAARGWALLADAFPPTFWLGLGTALAVVMLVRWLTGG